MTEPRGNRPGRPIPDRDRRALLATLDAWTVKGRFAAVRDRALYVLCLTTGLRLAEALRLDVVDVLADPPPATRYPSPTRISPIRIASQFYLTTGKAKGAAATATRDGYTSARSVFLAEPARDALRAYLLEATRRKWMPRRPWSGALFLTVKGRGSSGHTRLCKRTAQAHFRAWQERAGIADPYRFHDLRHTALSRLASAAGGDVHTVAVLAGHSSPDQTMQYLHADPVRLEQLTSAAAKRVRD